MPSEIDTLLRLVPDHSDHVLTHLSSHPDLASASDFSGYSLLHAAASYKQLPLLRTLVQTYHVDVNIRDSDGETPLFVAEHVDAVKCLVEELGADVNVQNGEGVGVVENARENVEDAGSWADVLAYLEGVVTKTTGTGSISQDGTDADGQDGGVSLSSDDSEQRAPPPLPPNVKINMGTMDEVPVDGEEGPDPEIRRRIEELAARDDFQTEEGQAELRNLIAQVVGGISSETEDRAVRRRVD